MNNLNYSSTVLLSLIVCGVELSLSHVGDDFIVVRKCDAVYDSCQAELVVSVDGDEDRRAIQLPSGIQKGGFIVAPYLELSVQ